MTDRRAPDDVFALALERSRARRERDWASADRLKADIEAAGWRVVDRGPHFRLEPAVPPDVLADDGIRHGSSGTVPSRLAEPSSSRATIVVLPIDLEERTDRAAAGWLARAGTRDTAVAVVPAEATGAGGPDQERLEVVRMAIPLTPGAAANAGFRRAPGDVVVLLSGGGPVTGDVVTPLVRALEDATVAVAGGRGSVTADLRHHQVLGLGEDADVILPPCLAFRRAEGIERGPFDERFLTAGGLFTWWSLVLRDSGEGKHPRRAVIVGGLPLEPREPATPDADGRDRSTRRDFYRLLERFGGRSDLTSGPRDRP